MPTIKAFVKIKSNQNLFQETGLQMQLIVSYRRLCLETNASLSSRNQKIKNGTRVCCCFVWFYPPQKGGGDSSHLYENDDDDEVSDDLLRLVITL